MKEPAFIKRNKARWEEFERVVNGQLPSDPDKLADLFIQVTDDLSFARTHYPDSRVTAYLNGLAAKVHLRIYRNKREERNRFVKFWKEDVPIAMYEARRPLFYSFSIFIVAMVIGIVSSVYDNTFVRLILGDAYVNMTLENIQAGTPTGVYGSMNEGMMFLMITLNNIKVSFYVFIAGVLTAITTGLLLFQNGVMVGAFVTLFAQENQLGHALPVIMLHGTIELASIVVAGAAGMVLGSGLLFPGTYSRLEAFRRGALRGTKIITGLVPFFVIAGFIESFVTRYEFMPAVIKGLIIGVSAVLMIYYFVIYPHLVVKRNANKPVD